MISLDKKEISIAIQTNKPIDDYKKIGILAENFKFDCITVYNDLLYQPPWIPLSLIAQATSSIKIGVASVNPFTSHPINIASNIALINEISKGRAYLGISRGAWLDYLGINQTNPIAVLYDSILVIKHLLKQSKESFKSKYFPLQGGDSLRWSIPHSDIPINLGSWGPKTIVKCKNLVSGIKLGGSANANIVSYYKNLLGNSHVDIILGCVTVVDEDSQKAKNLARKEVALYLPVIAKLDKTINIKSDLITEISSLASKFNYSGAAELIDDELLRKFSFSGTPEEIIDQSIEIFKKGATRIEFGTPHGIDSVRGIELLGTKVLPEIKARLGIQHE